MSNGTGGYTPLIQLLREISLAQDAGATVAALAMVYIGIDTMALLTCRIGQQDQERADFIDWVDKYLKADTASEYQYEGIDVYAARCAVLHSYGSSARLHSGINPPRKFGYVDNGPHKTDDGERFVLISVAVLIHDFFKSMETFMAEVLANSQLKHRLDSRIGTLFLTSLIDK